MLFTAQVTAAFDVPVTVAVNCCVSLGWRVACVGRIWIAMEPLPGPPTLTPLHPVRAALTLRSRIAPAFLMVPRFLGGLTAWNDKVRPAAYSLM